MSEPLEQYIQVRQNILAATPEQCKPCYRPSFSAGNLAERVVAGEVTLEFAKKEHESFFNENCPMGADNQAGCFGGVACGFGVVCKMPAPASLEPPDIFRGL